MRILKNIVPLLITAAIGFLLIVANYVPWMESWEQIALTWFDVLAAIAFVLGGGNLLASHLKKISDRVRGWGYSVVTLIAFLVTLIVGLAKFGVSPSPDQEYYGETFASLSIADVPDDLVFSVPGAIPSKTDAALPNSVVRQLSETPDGITIRGWMTPGQKADLLGYEDTLEWKCRVEQLAEAARPPVSLRGKIAYRADHDALAYSGSMSSDDHEALQSLGDSREWRQAVDSLFQQSRRETSVVAEFLPNDFQIPASLDDRLVVDSESRKLTLTGPLGTDDRAKLEAQFPLVHPLSEADQQRFLSRLESFGRPLDDDGTSQLDVFRAAFKGVWTAELLRQTLDAAGMPTTVPRSACDMLADKQAGQPVVPEQTEGEEVRLNDEQVAVLQRFAADSDASPRELAGRLAAAGPFTDGQRAALERFLQEIPTVGERNRQLYFSLVAAGPLSAEQREFLVRDARRELEWRRTVGRLFAASNPTKYAWSGAYNAENSLFWWLYEFALKPLTATMFALLAFYVASAAFRAFRAKNIEAILLLGTAFIILIGRTAAGVALTAWLPEDMAGLRIENVTVTIMKTFVTAGNRAIMIGIALGIASTSLRILLGIDRSYLGGGDD